MKKKIVKVIAVTAAIGSLAYLAYKFINEIKFVISSIIDSLESIRKSLFKVYVGKKIELHENYHVNLDKFCDDYAKKFKDMATKEDNKIEENVYEISEDD